MKCKVWMLTELFFVFLCKENQEKTNIELGQVKGIFYLNPIEILSSTVSRGRVTTNDLATKFLHLSDCSCTCLGCLQWAPDSSVKIKFTLFGTLVWNIGPSSWQCGPSAATKGPSAQSVNCSLYGSRFLRVKCPAWIIKRTRRMFVFIHFRNLSKISIF